jgi:hypothetical protein
VIQKPPLHLLEQRFPCGEDVRELSITCAGLLPPHASDCTCENFDDVASAPASPNSLWSAEDRLLLTTLTALRFAVGG